MTCPECKSKKTKEASAPDVSHRDGWGHKVIIYRFQCLKCGYLWSAMVRIKEGLCVPNTPDA